MIMTATSRKEAIQIEKWLSDNGFTYKGSLWYSQEWHKDDVVIFLHKGYDKEERPFYEWEQKMKGDYVA